MAKDESKQDIQSYRDLLGNQVLIGDYIGYSTLYGRSAAMKIGKIVRIRLSPSTRWNHSDAYSITVAGCEKNWNGKWERTKLGTLAFPTRTIRLNPAEIPQEAWDILNARN